MKLYSHIVLAACCSLPCPLLAQAPSEPPRGPDSTMRNFVPGIEVPALPGMPFVGKDTIEWNRPLDGGDSTTVSLEAIIARDSEGRVYRERHRFAPAGVDPKTTLYETFVNDPVNHTRTTCTLMTHRCSITNYRPNMSLAVQVVGPFDKGRRYLTRESLGTKSLEDLNVVGTLETITIAPGTVGNGRQLVESREFWYSSDLKTNVAVTRKDPREGTQTISLTVATRSDPDPQIFAVPVGFTVQDDRQVLSVTR
jgi:hypothetical protein